MYIAHNIVSRGPGQDKRCPNGMAIILKGRVQSGAGARAIASINSKC